MKNCVLSFPLVVAVLAGSALVPPAVAAPKSATIIAVSPANGDRTESPVTAISFAFSNPVKLESLRVRGPRGENSLEQVLVADGETVPLAASYNYPLRVPVAAVGRYEVALMAWEARTKTSISISYAFAIGTNEQINEYDEITARFDDAERLKNEAEPASEAAPSAQ
ncbi:copper resistance protein CopC [Novosphingobium sp.]|uniref:copper resistance protein CopC n=1 Tax=Novosphingobium sp. TaxID=1874826 RepID=UPI00286E5A02|nr:copper resistance protein CopC [Novosphingobium sp.]